MIAAVIVIGSLTALTVLALSAEGSLPSWLFVPYALQWLETVYGTLRPAIGWS